MIWRLNLWFFFVFKNTWTFLWMNKWIIGVNSGFLSVCGDILTFKCWFSGVLHMIYVPVSHVISFGLDILSLFFKVLKLESNRRWFSSFTLHTSTDWIKLPWGEFPVSSSSFTCWHHVINSEEMDPTLSDSSHFSRLMCKFVGSGLVWIFRFFPRDMHRTTLSPAVHAAVVITSHEVLIGNRSCNQSRCPAVCVCVCGL